MVGLHISDSGPWGCFFPSLQARLDSCLQLRELFRVSFASASKASAGNFTSSSNSVKNWKTSPAISTGISAFIMAFSSVLSGFAQGITLYVGEINAIMCLFNMIPIPPLDGFKVLKWDYRPYLINVWICVDHNWSKANYGGKFFWTDKRDSEIERLCLQVRNWNS